MAAVEIMMKIRIYLYNPKVFHHSLQLRRKSNNLTFGGGSYCYYFNHLIKIGIISNQINKKTQILGLIFFFFATKVIVEAQSLQGKSTAPRRHFFSSSPTPFGQKKSKISKLLKFENKGQNKISNFFAFQILLFLKLSIKILKVS